MTPKRKQRLYLVTAIVLLAALAVGLTLYALRANINAFYTPTQIASGEAPQGRQIRAGGMVRDGSVRRDNETLDAIFTVTDFDHDVTVHYQGILPDLFREGQGVVVMGTFDGEHLEASEVLAKHDEKYMPPEVSDALKASGRDVSGNRTDEQDRHRDDRENTSGGAVMVTQLLPEIGHFALILGACLACVQAVVPLAGAATRRPLWMSFAQPMAWGQFLFVLIAYACLTASFLLDDFSVAYIANNSNSQLPWYFKFSAVWGSHEGSVLLWSLILAGWGFAVFRCGARDLPRDMLARVLGIMGLISTGFMAFVLLTSNPFARLLPDMPADGADLNPLLQDIGLIIHPPMLYMGYVGFSVAFSFAHGGPAGRAPRCGMGTLGAPLDQHRLGVPDRRHRAGQLVGLLRAGLGRLVVLGPGGERLPDAVAGGDRPDPLTGGHREARCLQELDGAAVDLRLLAVTAGHLPGALRRADLGARLRQ